MGRQNAIKRPQAKAFENPELFAKTNKQPLFSSETQPDIMLKNSVASFIFTRASDDWIVISSRSGPEGSFPDGFYRTVLISSKFF